MLNLNTHFGLLNLPYANVFSGLKIYEKIASWRMFKYIKEHCFMAIANVHC